MNRKKFIRCTEYWKRMHVFVDGNVYPCCYSKPGVSSMGNVNEASLEEIWNSCAAQKHRTRIIENRFDEICWEWCPILLNGSLTEDKIAITKGPEAFVENQLLSRREISEKKVKIESLPQYHRFIPSLKCNLRCIMCFQNRDDKRELPRSYYEELRKWAPFIETINLQGGEPFCCDACLEMIDGVDFEKYPQIAFRMVTNGTLITDEMIDKMRKARFFSVLVSVNAATSETYARIMKGANWEKTMANIRRLTRFRDSLPEPFVIGLSFVVMKSNVDDLPFYPDLGKRFSVNPTLVPLRYDPGGESLFEKAEDVANLDKKMQQMHTRAREIGVSVATGQLENMINDFYKKQME